MVTLYPELAGRGIRPKLPVKGAHSLIVLILKTFRNTIIAISLSYILCIRDVPRLCIELYQHKVRLFLSERIMETFRYREILPQICNCRIERMSKILLGDMLVGIILLHWAGGAGSKRLQSIDPLDEITLICLLHLQHPVELLQNEFFPALFPAPRKNCR